MRWWTGSATKWVTCLVTNSTRGTSFQPPKTTESSVSSYRCSSGLASQSNLTRLRLPPLDHIQYISPKIPMYSPSISPFRSSFHSVQTSSISKISFRSSWNWCIKRWRKNSMENLTLRWKEWSWNIEMLKDASKRYRKSWPSMLTTLKSRKSGERKSEKSKRSTKNSKGSSKRRKKSWERKKMPIYSWKGSNPNLRTRTRSWETI